ncbi:ketopantoate reductase family protein [Paenibacillus xerothermodurans]|uniref:2-dehydropantoate 2-reductase n=1 Tax=Paenibacillus xerothermodurans TaxID=1977292 RepID=A0A2W1NT28_PAEXE|nr:2-dehydropantoate 2-reductase [Paenibacillus xerothermodurans]PZE22665.1 2-dehydropantoate 2-reductase [Paenibacillus xerothermodurans]
MLIRVIGAGALGMLTAAYLCRTAAKVEIITRTEQQARLLREQGLQLTAAAENASMEPRSGTAGETVEFPEVLTFEQTLADGLGGRARPGSPDFILLTVKQTAITDKLAHGIVAQLGADSRLICFQNGVGHLDVLRKVIPARQILLAVTTEGAMVKSPRHVAHTGRGMTWVGSAAAEPDFAGRSDHSLTKKFVNVLSDAGFSTSLSNNIISKVWNKLLINAIINPLTAVLQIHNGQLPQLPDALILMRSLYYEAVTLADKLGIELAPDLWQQVLLVCERTAGNRSSMLQDVLLHRPTEVDAITGGLLREAEQAGIAMPTHAAMYHLLRSIEQQWMNIT